MLSKPTGILGIRSRSGFEYANRGRAQSIRHFAINCAWVTFQFLLPNPIACAIMASVVRPSLLRQSRITPAARQALRRHTPQTYALSKLNISSFRTQSIASRTLPLRSYLSRGTSPNMLRVAAFHASGRRPILPAGPRECHRSCTVAISRKLTLFDRGH